MSRCPTLALVALLVATAACGASSNVGPPLEQDDATDGSVTSLEFRSFDGTTAGGIVLPNPFVTGVIQPGRHFTVSWDSSRIAGSKDPADVRVEGRFFDAGGHVLTPDASAQPKSFSASLATGQARIAAPSSAVRVSLWFHDTVLDRYDSANGSNFTFEVRPPAATLDGAYHCHRFQVRTVSCDTPHVGEEFDFDVHGSTFSFDHQPNQCQDKPHHADWSWHCNVDPPHNDPCDLNVQEDADHTLHIQFDDAALTGFCWKK